MNREELQARIRKFGVRTIRLVDTLPRSKSAGVIGKQLLRSATSIGANYTAACRGRSRADFVSKRGIALEEADESLYWLEMLVESGIVAKKRVADLVDEGRQLVAILFASSRTARSNLKS